MPELPEVETVRRMLEAQVVGRMVLRCRLSGVPLRVPIPRGLPARLRGRTIERVRRIGKYLLIDLDRGVTVISHLGMSGRWLYVTPAGMPAMPHVHARLEFEDGSSLWFQDPRRFGLLKWVASDRALEDPALAVLGRDPVLSPPSGTDLATLARGARIAVKSFLLDQRRLAGIGNIYASEILHRARIDPRRRSGSLTRGEWNAVAPEITAVLGEAIERMGTTFSAYRTLWNEPGAFGEKLLVYDRAAEPCRRCRTPIRRIVQGQRSTFFCPTCQPRRPISRSEPAQKAGR